MSASLPHPASLQLLRRVIPFGGQVYEVGGTVRDRLLGLESKDLDYVVTGIPADAFSTVFMWDRVDYVGESFGVYKIQLRELGEPTTPVLDVALPRTEVSSGPGHRDFRVTASSNLRIQDDLARRDFTFNALAYDVENQEVIDPHGGQRDLQARTLRFVGQAADRIREDPLRILRAFRFMVKLNLDLPGTTVRAAIWGHSHLLANVAPERIFSELWTMLSYADARPEALVRALHWMRTSGVLGQIIPEYRAACCYDQGSPYHHLPLAEHMIESVGEAQRIGASPITKLTLLLHDLGKPATRTEGADGRAHYFGHEDVGAELAGVILSRLRAPGQLLHAVPTLIRHHMRLTPREMPGRKGLRRFMHDLGPLWPDSLDHRYADLMTHHPDLHTGLKPIDWLLDTRAACRAAGETVSTFSDHALALTGQDIMRLTGLTPGPELGVVKQALTDAVINGEIENAAPALTAHLLETL